MNDVRIYYCQTLQVPFGCGKGSEGRAQTSRPARPVEDGNDMAVHYARISHQGEGGSDTGGQAWQARPH